LFIPRITSRGRVRVRFRAKDWLKSSFTFSVCDSILFWQRGGNRPTLACRFPENPKEIPHELRGSLVLPIVYFFDYAYTVRSGVSPDSFPTVWKPRGRDLLSSKNIWPRKSARIRFPAGAKSHDVCRCGCIAACLPETHPIHRP